MAMIIIMLLLMTAILIFAVQNAAPVAVTFLAWQSHASLAIIIFLSVMTGAVIGIILSSFWMFKRTIKKKPPKEEATGAKT